MEPVALLAFLLVTSLPLGESLDCHVCELENDFGCLNAVPCGSKQNRCIVVAMKIFPRFYIVSKQCTRDCPITDTDTGLVPILVTAQPSPTQTLSKPTSKVYTLQEPMPFMFIRCCSDDLCNEQGPPARLLSPYFKQRSGASRERHRPPWLPTLWALSVAATLAGLV